MKITPDIEKKFNTWIEVMKPFIESSAFDDIMKFLKAESQKGKVICPASKDTFKSFTCCNRHKLKAIMIYQDPYPTFRNEVMVADGIPLSCSYTKYLQPSLYHFWQSIEDSYGFDPDNDLRADLNYLLEEEHIMIINAGLSCEKDKSGSHNSIWVPLMQYWLEEVIGKLYSGLPIVLSGNTAWRLEKWINPMVHMIKKIEHPVSAAYQDRKFKYEDCYKWIDNIIRQNNGESEVPKWTRKRGEGKKVDTGLPLWISEHVDIPKAQDRISDFPWEK